jgi:hypothetical protein
VKYEGECLETKEDTLDEWLRQNSLFFKLDGSKNVEDCLIQGANGALCNVATLRKTLLCQPGTIESMGKIYDYAYQKVAVVKWQPRTTEIPKEVESAILGHRYEFQVQTDNFLKENRDLLIMFKDFF